MCCLEKTIYPQNLSARCMPKALADPIKILPDRTLKVALVDTVIAGTTITLTATANDASVLYGRWSRSPLRTLLPHSTSCKQPTMWLKGCCSSNGRAADGFFDNAVEDVVATVDNIAISGPLLGTPFPGES
ncbi:MAG: hypothetical protein MZV70_62125 [Desulfobacterales bacterium]|nr:hypothetical protein [Desulfobacterales bacterium]